MERYIEIKSCSGCPYIARRIGFESPAYVPTCAKTKNRKTIPYTEHASGGRVVARATDDIPDWCPLDTFYDLEEARGDV